MNSSTVALKMSEIYAAGENNRQWKIKTIFPL